MLKILPFIHHRQPQGEKKKKKEILKKYVHAFATMKFRIKETLNGNLILFMLLLLIVYLLMYVYLLQSVVLMDK